MFKTTLLTLLVSVLTLSLIPVVVSQQLGVKHSLMSVLRPGDKPPGFPKPCGCPPVPLYRI